MGGVQRHVHAHGQEREQPGELHRPDDQPQLLKRAEAGTALIGTLVGTTIFLILLLLSAQVLLHLYASSTLSAAADSAATQVADAGGAPASVPGAQQAALGQLGTWGARHAAFDWLAVDGNQVVLRLRATTPQLLPLPGGWAQVVATVTVRTERFR